MSNVAMEPGERLRVLFEKGSQVDVDKNIPIRRYFRSCQELIRMAGVYFEEKDFETSYVYYAKFIVLSFEKLRTHPQYNQVPVAEKNANKKALKMAFERAEKLKPVLKKKYEEAYKRYLQHQEQVAEIARQEEERRRQEEERIKEEHERLKNEQEDEKKRHERKEMDAFVKEQRRKEMEMERLAVEAQYGNKTKVDDNQPLIPVDFAPPPIIPTPSTVPEPSSIKALPVTITALAPTKPTFDRSLKPTIENNAENHVANESAVDQITTAFAASLTISKNKYGLRTILSPADLPAKFMKIAQTNTSRNIETCGVLFGKLANEVFIITHVLVPHQKGAPDSCDTTREEDMWDFQDQYNGICLGWIHTHPSQTAFLSSVDLHTHYPYQCLMPESVAIVCSGKFNETGYFMLTPNYGMNLIGKCQKPGFHPHPSNPALFEGCDHVKTSSSHSVQIIDWRNK